MQETQFLRQFIIDYSKNNKMVGGVNILNLLKGCFKGNCSKPSAVAPLPPAQQPPPPPSSPPVASSLPLSPPPPLAPPSVAAPLPSVASQLPPAQPPPSLPVASSLPLSPPPPPAPLPVASQLPSALPSVAASSPFTEEAPYPSLASTISDCSIGALSQISGTCASHAVIHALLLNEHISALFISKLIQLEDWKEDQYTSVEFLESKYYEFGGNTYNLETTCIKLSSEIFAYAFKALIIRLMILRIESGINIIYFPLYETFHHIAFIDKSNRQGSYIDSDIIIGPVYNRVLETDDYSTNPVDIIAVIQYLLKNILGLTYISYNIIFYCDFNDYKGFSLTPSEISEYLKKSTMLM